MFTFSQLYYLNLEMFEQEKKPYQDKAAELKSEYEKALENLKNENEDVRTVETFN